MDKTIENKENELDEEYVKDLEHGFDMFLYNVIMYLKNKDWLDFWEKFGDRMTIYALKASMYLYKTKGGNFIDKDLVEFLDNIFNESQEQLSDDDIKTLDGYTVLWDDVYNYETNKILCDREEYKMTEVSEDWYKQMDDEEISEYLVEIMEDYINECLYDMKEEVADDFTRYFETLPIGKVTLSAIYFWNRVNEEQGIEKDSEAVFLEEKLVEMGTELTNSDKEYLDKLVNKQLQNDNKMWS